MFILSVVLVACIMMLIEARCPGRKWKQVKGWWARAAILNAAQVLVIFISGYAWNVWFQEWAVFHLEDYLGKTAAAFTAYFLITFVFYWWHRMRHEIDFLWVWLHQIHHSAQRIEILTTFYKHPAEIVINSLMMGVIMYAGLGLAPETAIITTLLTGFGELFYHWNVKTPYWIGFIFQRPESHCIHHQRGWHRQNFSDLPLWDMLFGTFHNPKDFEKECGFRDNREVNLASMLRGMDINPRKTKSLVITEQRD